MGASNNKLCATIPDDPSLGQESRPDTHINDLPDDCLVKIFRRLGSPSTFPRIRHRRKPVHVTLTHPLRCAIVCKRWRAVCDAAVLSLSFKTSTLTQPEAEHIGTRFKYLTALKFQDFFSYWQRDALVTLARLSTQLQVLELSDDSEFSNNLAEALRSWTGLTRFDLGSTLFSSRPPNYVKTILDAVRELPSLTHLGLSYKNDDILDVCEQLGNITGLTTLELTCQNVPPALPGHFLDTLRHLTICKFPEDELPETLGLLTGLEALRIDTSMELTSLPQSLGDLSLLTRLDIMSCKELLALPSSLGNLSLLQAFHVKYCYSLESWPDSLSNLQSLRTLEAYEAGRSLPRGVSRLALLENLSVHGNISLPEDIRELTGLKKLKLSAMLSDGSENDEVPDWIRRLGGLEVLRLHEFFDLPRLPEALGTLTALRELDLHQCGQQMEALPESLSNLTRLEICKLRSLPSLKHLPNAIGKWRLLKELKIIFCASLTSLQDQALARLTSLRKLKVYSCPGLASLPETLGLLSHLEVLRIVSCERLTKLPDAVEDLELLQVLEVRGCLGIRSLPLSLKGRRSLQVAFTTVDP